MLWQVYFVNTAIDSQFFSFLQSNTLEKIQRQLLMNQKINNETALIERFKMSRQKSFKICMKILKLKPYLARHILDLGLAQKWA